ncbi:cyclin-dependent kinase 2-associated protein 1 isoform X1 [Rattus rattus]|nr:cyclin-dependent kinase 2-associated protein 1 isoform X1 [Rattus rattus]
MAGDILRRRQGEDSHICRRGPSRRQQKSARAPGRRSDGCGDVGAARPGPRPWPRRRRCARGLARLCLARPPPAGMSYKPNLTAHMPAAALNAGSVHSPSTSMATSSQYRQLLSDYGPPSLGYTQGTGNSQVPQSKYAELLAIIEELGKEIRPTYAGSKSAMERLKRGIIHARSLVRECLAETERNARS